MNFKKTNVVNGAVCAEEKVSVDRPNIKPIHKITAPKSINAILASELKNAIS